MTEQHPTHADILAALAPRFARPEQAQSWFETAPVPGFGSSTAEQLVAAGRGTEVLDFIAAVDAGVFA